MLTLNNVTINLQNFGSILCIHLTGPDKDGIEARYFSFYNHETVGGELEWENDIVSPFHAFFWVYSNTVMTAMDKLILGLARGALFEMLPPNSHKHTKGTDLWPLACGIAFKRYEQIESVTWLDIRTEVDFGAGYSMGDSVTAEKGSGNFDDEVLARVVTRGGNATLDMIRAKQKEHEDAEATATEEEESVGETV
jgi:hypothetical protein